MKKILFLAMLLVINYNTKAQTITVNNKTSCSMTVTLVANDPASTCISPAAFLTSVITISSGGTTGAYSWNTAPWLSPGLTPSGPVHWEMAWVEDDPNICSPSSFASVGDAVTCGYSTTGSFSSCCTFGTVNVTWTVVAGNIIVDIR